MLIIPKEYQEICFPEWDNVAFGRKEGWETSNSIMNVPFSNGLNSIKYCAKF